MKKITFEVGFVKQKNEKSALIAFIICTFILYIVWWFTNPLLSILFGAGYLVIFFLSRLRIKFKELER